MPSTGTLRKRRESAQMSKTDVHVKRNGRELPEDIMADSGEFIFKAKEQPFYRRKRFNFIIGVSVGLLAMYVASTTPVAQTHLNTFHDYLLLQLADIDLASMLPQSDMVDEFLGNFTNLIKPSAPSSEIPFMPALKWRDELGLKPHFPVVMIPGIVSSGLESWGTEEQSRKYFRKRMWGTMAMVRSVLLDKYSWIEHIMLDPVTGIDPKGYKIRAVQGVEAADYFITGYWVWAKIIENLGTIGYDNNNMYFASYDWRLSFSNLEVRDRYFSKLKTIMELSKKSSGQKSVVVTHSMGGSMFPYFLKWVESDMGGKGGPKWVNDHIESLVNIAGPLVGVPKAVTSLLSGETRDTMALGNFGAYILEKFFSRRERTKLMRSWFGGASMLPKGGETIWGTADSAPDDEKEEHHQTFGNLISFVPHPQGINENSTDIPSGPKDVILKNYTVSGSIDLLLKNADANFEKQLYANYSFGVTTNLKQLKKNENDPTKWSNPLESRLPNAPDLKIYCFYGVGVPTERSYYYAVTDEAMDNECESDVNSTGCTHDNGMEHHQHTAEGATKKEDSSNTSRNSNMSRNPDFHIDSTVSDPIQRVETGIRFSDGDGTVPLLSLGYMCTPSGAWRKHSDLYNPGNAKVIIREYLNEDAGGKLDVRGGIKASNHIDILGNWEMLLELLQLVSGKGENVVEKIISDIEQQAKKIQLK